MVEATRNTDRHVARVVEDDDAPCEITPRTRLPLLPQRALDRSGDVGNMAVLQPTPVGTNEGIAVALLL